MNSPVVFRYVLFALFSLFSLVTLALASGSISQTKVLGSSSSIARVDALLIVNSLLGLLAMFIIIPLERIRSTAFTSRISFEVCWVGVLCLLDFCASAAVTAIGVEDVCSSTWGAVLPRSACGTVGALQAFSWLSAFALLFHVLFLVFSTRRASARISGIWKMTVIEVEWSGPSSPSLANAVLPSYHEKQIPVYTAGVKPLIIVEKKPTLEQPVVQKVVIPPPAQHKRTSDLVITPASVNATPPLYPQFFTSTQARAAAAQQSSPAGHTASPNLSSISTSPRSGRSSPTSSTSSSPSSPVSSSQDVASKQENEPSSRSSSPRTKRRPPPLNLGGLSAFTAAEKSKRQARA